jgi:GTP cyclohydrolase I
MHVSILGDIMQSNSSKKSALTQAGSQSANIEASTSPNAANENAPVIRPSKAEAMEAVKTLLRWAGDNPAREGLIDTPKRVVEAYEEFFAGYQQSAEEALSRTFSEVSGYDDIVLLKNMRLESHCEHHMAPIIGMASVAYIPNDKVVGISKIARVIDVFAKRLQTQEILTNEIADAIQNALQPKGVAVYIDAGHQCMTMRGVHKIDTTTITTRMHGVFRDDRALRSEFMALVTAPPAKTA